MTGVKMPKWFELVPMGIRVAVAIALATAGSVTGWNFLDYRVRDNSKSVGAVAGTLKEYQARTDGGLAGNSKRITILSGKLGTIETQQRVLIERVDNERKAAGEFRLRSDATFERIEGQNRRLLDAIQGLKR